MPMKKRNKIKAYLIILAILIFSLQKVIPQEELLGAKELLKNISDNFRSTIKDYKAEIKWIQNDITQTGTLYFKNPQKMRINFTEPEGQVICTNGYELWVYIKTHRLLLHQNILEKEKVKNEEGKTETIISPILLNSVGLDKFLVDYSIQYHETKEKVFYKDNSKVYKFKLIRWRSSKNGFNTIFLTVQENGLIRKVEGITAAYRHIFLEIDNIEINKNVSELVFNYTPPAHCNTVENFIISQEGIK